MPEVLEAEIYRRHALGILGRTFERVTHVDGFVTRPLARGHFEAALVGTRATEVGRRGKLVVVGLDSGVTLGLHFGMAGRLLVDRRAALDKLEYALARLEERWFRFGVRFDDGGSMELVDPRRLARVSIDPDLGRLGPDVVGLTRHELDAALSGARVALKARLLDQSRLAGLGNLLVDEVLWRAGLAPDVDAGSLRPDDRSELLRVIGETLEELGERGGSHTGDLHPARVPGSRCPSCGTPLNRGRVGGRTTYWCPHEQA